MTKKPYRNALRSKNMIRAAFLELLSEKKLEQITVADVIRRSDLSRNTFYAHYQDIYAVLEEFQADMLCRMNEVLDEAVDNRIFDNPLPLLVKVAECVEENKDAFRILMNIEQSNVFINRLKDMIISRINENSDITGIKDHRGFLVLMESLALGFIHLFKRYLRGEGDLTSEDIVNEINKLFRAALPVYR